MTTRSAAREQTPLQPRVPGRIRAMLDSPLATYHILIGASALLLIMGLIMVFSASSVESYKLFGSSFVLAERQFMFAGIGVLLMLGVSRLPISTVRKSAWPLLILAVLLLMAVLVIGVSVAGQRNWIALGGPFRFQPSELAKLALVIWGADLLARKEPLLGDMRHLLIPLLPVSGLLIGLVLLEKDLGTVLIMVPIVAGLLFAAGAGYQIFVWLGAASLIAIAMLSMGASYRLGRFSAWLHQDSDPTGVGWQLTHARYAFALGGWWGQGLGASKEKWGSLPEAHTDFIFAVVGEELGLFGTLVMLALFAVLIFAALRVARESTDLFVQLAATAITAWIGIQTLFNLGAVLGVLPITGVPLPLVSYGGSSLLPTMAALGLLIAFARQQPDARRALADRQRERSRNRAAKRAKAV